MKKKARLGNAAIFREFNGVGQTPRTAPNAVKAAAAAAIRYCGLSKLPRRFCKITLVRSRWTSRGCADEFSMSESYENKTAA